MRRSGGESASEQADARAPASSGRRRLTALPPGGTLSVLQAGVGNRAVIQMLRQAGLLRAEQEHQHSADCGHESGRRAVLQRSTVPAVLRGAGRPLDPALRADLEPKMGADFSAVRVHDDAAAQASAAEIRAGAYTSGNHIVIGKGGADRRTMAHELTHVIQQSRGQVAGTDDGSGLRISDPSDGFEREAEANAARIVSGAAQGRRQAGDLGREGTALRAASEASEVVVQRTVEDDLISDPGKFMESNMLSMDTLLGMGARRPVVTLPKDRQEPLITAYRELAKSLGALNRHWFLLTPDPRRGKNAYVLTPALEKYVADQEYQEKYEFLWALVGNSDLPPVEPDNSYLRSSYIPYLTGGAKSPETDVGHQEIPGKPGDARGASLVFTATMNGCAIAVTGSEEKDMFRAWHYQSPGSRMSQAMDFHEASRPMDWFGPEEYMGPKSDGFTPEAANVLSYAQDSWKILSQEVHVSQDDASQASITRAFARPLNLGSVDDGTRFRWGRVLYEGPARQHQKDLAASAKGTRKEGAPPEVQQKVAETHANAFMVVNEILDAKNPDELYRSADPVVSRCGDALLDLRNLQGRYKDSGSQGWWYEKLAFFIGAYESYLTWLVGVRDFAARTREPDGS